MTTNLKFLDDTFSMAGDGITDDGTAENAKGGTELMREALFSYVDGALLDKFNIISTRVRKLDEEKPNILWIHDTWNDPEVQRLADPEWRKNFAKLVFVSHYQQTTFNIGLGIPYDDGVVVKNAIDPISEHEKPDYSEQLNVIYHTTPHRGLELLVPAFSELCKMHENIHLDVYSSFQIYGWDHRDEPYKPLYEQIDEHPNMTYHGYKSNEVVRNALKKAHIFAYPSIWVETSCIAAIEALSAGCIVVSPTLGALPETCANWAIQYPYTEDVNKHINIFANALHNTINAYRNHSFTTHRLQAQKIYYNNYYAWNNRMYEWEMVLKNLT